MANFITLTPHPITVHTKGKGRIAQPLWTVVDVSNFDILDLELGVHFLNADVAAKFSIETSMQNQSDSDEPGKSEWIAAGEFQQSIAGHANEPPSPQWQKVHISSQNGNGFLKYVRWRVDVSASATLTFFIRGIARRWAR